MDRVGTPVDALLKLPGEAPLDFRCHCEDDSEWYVLSRVSAVRTLQPV